MKDQHFVPKKTLRVSVVEDSVEFSNWIKEELKQLVGITVEEFGGVPAVASGRILSEKPDVIILDIRLQGGTGFDVLKEISSSNLKPKVIMFTNYPWQVFEKQAYELGADYFLDKSFEANKLRLVVKEIQNNAPTIII